MLLDHRVETVTPRTMALLAARPLVAIASAALVALVLSPAWASLWLAAVALSEVWTWLATKAQRSGRPATMSERQAYFASIVFMNVVWCSLAVLLWLQADAAFVIAATCLLATQVFHAQIFTAQSPAMLVVVGGFPAATLLGLASFQGNLDVLHRLLVVGAVVILIAYAGSAAAANARRDQHLESARNDAVSAREAQSRLLAIVSHEVRTPLSGLVGMAEALKAAGPRPDQVKKIDLMIGSGREMARLLDDLLQLSSLDAGVFRITPEPFDTAQFIAGLDASWRSIAEHAGLSLDLTASDGFPAALHGDAGRIAQIINNLIGNGIKFTSRGSVSVRFAWSDGALCVAVEDTGRGLSQADLGALFRPFSRIEATNGEAPVSGTGLGLYISLKLAAAMGGKLVATSTPGVGSRFELRAPAPIAADKARQQRSSRPGTVVRILVVEDHPAQQLIAHTLLEALGCEPVVVEGAEAALDLMTRSQFDVLLVDILLPGLSGMDLVDQARAHNLIGEDVPAIAMTAEPEFRNTENRFRMVLPKPLSASALADALKKVLPTRVLSG
jgi:two-component system, sensor histidine kinase